MFRFIEDFLIRILLKKEVVVMAELYATLIINDRRTFASVPKSQKERVRQILIDSGNEHLIVE